MTPDEIRKKSVEKAEQLNNLAILLKIKIEAKQRINKEGFIETLVIFTDTEDYPKLQDPIQESLIETPVTPSTIETKEEPQNV